MRMLVLLALIGAALGACQRPTPQDEARDVATLDAAWPMTPPAVPLAPQPVSFAELEAPGSPLHLPPDVPIPEPGEGCAFIPAGGAAQAPVFVAVPAVGLIKLEGRVTMLAAESGSPRLAAGLHRAYAGGGNFLQLTEGDPAAEPNTHKASLTIRDPYARIVYFSAGALRCGARKAVAGRSGEGAGAFR